MQWTAPQPFISSLTSYLNDNLGLQDNLATTWGQATADGKSNLAVAGTIMVVDTQQVANAAIKSGAQVNEDDVRAEVPAGHPPVPTADGIGPPGDLDEGGGRGAPAAVEGLAALGPPALPADELVPGEEVLVQPALGQAGVGRPRRPVQ